MTAIADRPPTPAPYPRVPRARYGAPAVDIVVPVHNEQGDLRASIERLHAFLTGQFPFTFRVTIADNASTDHTWPIAEALAEELPGVQAVRLEEKGRGRALAHVWGCSDAAVLAYMDVDLSTDLAALLPLVAPLLSGHSDIAIGTRLSRSARVVRGPKRELISRSYNLILRATLRTRFSDAQCGFKAVRADRARELLPLIEDTGWFFDTELLVLAERRGLRIHEIPVDWVDDPDSRVDIRSTAMADLRGIARLTRGLASGRLPVAGAVPDPGLLPQLTRFAVVGVASTVAYLLLYVLLRSHASAQTANLLALLITTIGNTAANRRLTFGVRGPTRAARHQVQGLAVFATGLLLTSSALALLHAASARPARAVEVVVLVTANLAATVLRFLLFRAWVFRPGSLSTNPMFTNSISTNSMPTKES
jgi:putative flippase GtrA